LENESKRIKVLTELQRQRKELIQPTIMSEINPNNKLNPEIIKTEQDKAVANATKELKKFINKIKGISCKENEMEYTRNLSRMENLHKNCVEKMLHNKEMKIQQQIDKEKMLVEKWEETRAKSKENRRFLKELEHKESVHRRELVKLKEDYRKKKLLEKIKLHDKRSRSFNNQKVGMGRLKQEIRKNVAYGKYKAKQLLEKMEKQPNTIHNKELMGKIFEDAGLGNMWKLTNGSSSNKVKSIDIYMELPKNTL